MSEPTTAAGRTLVERMAEEPLPLMPGDRVPPFPIIEDAILAIEAEARAAAEAVWRAEADYQYRLRLNARAVALDEARAAVQDTRRSLTAGPGQDATDVHIAWALGEALAAIDALREDADKP